MRSCLVTLAARRRCSRGSVAMGWGCGQSKVVRIAQTESTNAAAMVGDWSGDGVEELRARRGVADCRESVQVGVVGSLRDLGTAMKIRHALAKWEPLQIAVRIVLARAQDLEVGGIADGGFNAEDATSLVVHLDGVAA